MIARLPEFIAAGCDRRHTVQEVVRGASIKPVAHYAMPLNSAIENPEIQRGKKLLKLVPVELGDMVVVHVQEPAFSRDPEAVEIGPLEVGHFDIDAVEPVLDQSEQLFRTVHMFEDVGEDQDVERLGLRQIIAGLASDQGSSGNSFFPASIAAEL